MNTEITLDLLTSAFKDSTEINIIENVDFQEDEVYVVPFVIKDREEFPIYVSLDNAQILCMSYVWKEDEIKPDKRADLLDALLTMNLLMPLSSFSKLGNQYVIFGALSIQVDINAIEQEIKTLSDNTLDAIEALSEYLY